MAKQSRTTKRKNSAGEKATPPVDITPLVRHAQLRYLRMRKSESVLIAAPESKPDLNQTINIEVGHNDAEGAAVVVQATFTLDGRDVLHIGATFEILYGFDAAVKISPEQMGAFGHLIGINNAWPYWREFVQSMTSRMGLPSLTLPLLRLDLTKPPAIESKKASKPRKKNRAPANKKRKKA